MIPIRFKSVNSIYKLYHFLLDIRDKQRNRAKYIKNLMEINVWCRKNIIIDSKSYSFPDIIMASYEEVKKIANVYGCCNHKLDDKYKKFIIDTLYKSRFPRTEFVEELQVTVCPYCNRNFVNSTNNRTMCDLDHFFDKHTYPILAVSFHNLIPVCHSCNHAKSNSEIGYSPHDNKFSTDDLLHFDYHITGLDYLYNNSQINIEIHPEEILEKNVDVLKLRDVYQIHTDVVQECIKKATIFNPTYLEDLYNTYSDLFSSREELDRIVYGNYLEESDYGKRPLSKLTKDIVSQLLLDVYGIDL